MEHWRLLSAAMVDRQENFLNSNPSRMAKTVTFWPCWQPFNSFYFETVSFSLCFSFYFLLRKKVGGGGFGVGWAWPPRPPQCRRHCIIWPYNNIFGFITTVTLHDVLNKKSYQHNTSSSTYLNVEQWAGWSRKIQTHDFSIL